MKGENDRPYQIISERRFKLGVERLATAPLDLIPCGARVWKSSPGAVGSVQHGELFRSYVQELTEVIPEARRIWNAIIADCEKRTESREEAMIEAIVFQPAGAAFDARVVAVVRKYWLACDLLNQKVAENERVSPQVFVLQWLIKEREQQAVEVLAGMPYWPIGLDRDGNWI